MLGSIIGPFIGLLVPLSLFFLIGFVVWIRHQEKLMDSTARLSAEKAAQYAAHNRELEERVRVLERIVTDKGYDIAAQIEALRDTHRVENKKKEG